MDVNPNWRTCIVKEDPPMEYFAGGTEAYFYSFVRAELKEYDPVLHDRLEDIWGPMK